MKHTSVCERLYCKDADNALLFLDMTESVGFPLVPAMFRSGGMLLIVRVDVIDMTLTERKADVLDELVMYVTAMRNAQNRYYVTRFRDALHDAEAWEKKVDEFIADIKSGKALSLEVQEELF